MPFRRPSDGKCPACQGSVPESAHRCPACSYGLRPQPTPARRKAKKSLSKEEAAIARVESDFHCAHCGSFGADSRRVPAGSELSRLFNKPGVATTRFLPQQKELFLAMRCLFCGVVQLIDPERFLRRPRSVWQKL